MQHSNEVALHKTFISEQNMVSTSSCIVQPCAVTKSRGEERSVRRLQRGKKRPLNTRYLAIEGLSTNHHHLRTSAHWRRLFTPATAVLSFTSPTSRSACSTGVTDAVCQDFGSLP